MRCAACCWEEATTCHREEAAAPVTGKWPLSVPGSGRHVVEQDAAHNRIGVPYTLKAAI
jgi:hypothetical protein